MKSQRTLLARSFLVQGSWNYRTLLGTGMLWALLPLLRRGDGDETAARARLGRNGEHFNAHPYLTPVALGALGQLERAGEDPERIRRFRKALAGPLGSLGDTFVWAVWRPVCLLVALTLATLAIPPLLVAVAFLTLYNVVHVGLRAWGIRVGSELGFRVSEALRRLRLPHWAERIGAVGVLFLGLLSGALTVRGLELPGWGLPWLLGGATFFLVGFTKGDLFRRWVPALALVLVVGGLLAGLVWPLG